MQASAAISRSASDIPDTSGRRMRSMLSYREVDNIHFFEALVRQAFKNGRVRLSDAFE